MTAVHAYGTSTIRRRATKSEMAERLEAEIESRVDEQALAAIKAAEESEREVLSEIAATARGQS